MYRLDGNYYWGSALFIILTFWDWNSAYKNIQEHFQK